MPFKSKAQERYFQMIAHNKGKAKKKGDLTPDVAEKFIHDSAGEEAPKREHVPTESGDFGKKTRFSKTMKKIKK